jgi:hypothetical protein
VLFKTTVQELELPLMLEVPRSRDTAMVIAEDLAQVQATQRVAQQAEAQQQKHLVEQLLMETLEETALLLVVLVTLLVDLAEVAAGEALEGRTMQ